MLKTLVSVLVDRANYGRIKPLLIELDRHTPLDLQCLLGGSLVLDRFGHAYDIVARDQLQIAGKVYHEIEGNTHATMARSIGLGIQGYVDAYERLRPDALLLIGDRYEMLAAAIAGYYTKVPIIHLQGGEVSGTLDDVTRGLISNMASYHVPATWVSASRLTDVFKFMAIGCPSADMAATIDQSYRSGKIICVYHPDTAEGGDDMGAILTALEMHGKPTLMFWPNIDAGSDAIAKTIRRYGKRPWLETVKNLAPEDYMKELCGASCLVGNSSSFVRDASFFGTPAVLVGNRQSGREQAGNCITVKCTAGDVYSGIKAQWENRSEPSDLYGTPGISAEIAGSICELFNLDSGRSFDLDDVQSEVKDRVRFRV